jgi:hypothetical protein
MHILVLGQSNVASHGKERRVCDWGCCWHEAKRYALVDPLPGGTGTDGSVWTRLAPRLQARGDVADFAVTVLAQGGTSVADWAPAGKCHQLLLRSIPSIRETPPLTHILYHQGERDTFLKTAKADYVASFRALAAVLTAVWPGVPLILCTVSYRMGETSEAVRDAQAELVASVPGCRPGPDTDSLGRDMRRDGTHFNAAGLEAFADMLARILP